MFKNFSGLLQPYIECDDGSESLYQQCIKIDSIFDFLDLDLSHLTGDRLQEFELLTSLKTCMTLATIHKFCRRGSPKDPKRISSRNAFDKKYEAFFGMALHHWQKACECLEARMHGHGCYDSKELQQPSPFISMGIKDCHMIRVPLDLFSAMIWRPTIHYMANTSCSGA
jgi:hypothetical protein